MTHSVPSQQIHWPQGLSNDVFLRQYWQQKPLLIRQAFPAFQSPLTADELAGLSLEDGIPSRLITQDEQGHYHLSHGPFEESLFAELTDNRWSLLISDLDKHLPELTHYLQAFRFIPDWRIDDLMASYAPVGASVGAHVDEYDVFLLQASGTRRWMIDDSANPPAEIHAGGDLKILRHFTPSQDYTLLPGDMLYLPPGVPHHGIAEEGPCTTWSIGFRAPLLSQWMIRLAELVAEPLGEQRYRDPELVPVQAGEIDQRTVEHCKQLWKQMTAMSDEQFARLLGQSLTESAAESPGTFFISDEAEDHERPATDDNGTEQRYRRLPFIRFAWYQPDQNQTQAGLFVDGHSMDCSVSLAQTICADPTGFTVDVETLNADDQAVITKLIEQGWIELQEPTH